MRSAHEHAINPPADTPSLTSCGNADPLPSSAGESIPSGHPSRLEGGRTPAVAAQNSAYALGQMNGYAVCMSDVLDLIEKIRTDHEMSRELHLALHRGVTSLVLDGKLGRVA